MARLAKILKDNKVDKIVSYYQMPQGKDGKILFGWKERDDLPKNEELILSKPIFDDGVILSTKEDYVLYFRSLTGMRPEEAIADPSDARLDNLIVEKDFLLGIANLLTSKEGFVWKESTRFSILAEKVTDLGE